MNDSKPRWQYRFDNFSRAFILLREAVEIGYDREMSPLEREGLIQRFEYCWELAWKTMKDLLDAEGVDMTLLATPRTVVRAAFAAGLITHGPDWMAALDARNKMSHVYSFQAFEQVAGEVRDRYLSLFDSLHEKLLSLVVNPE